MTTTIVDLIEHDGTRVYLVNNWIVKTVQGDVRWICNLNSEELSFVFSLKRFFASDVTAAFDALDLLTLYVGRIGGDSERLGCILCMIESTNTTTRG